VLLRPEPLPLVRRRLHAQAVSQAQVAVSDAQARQVIGREVARLGLTLSDAELQFHREVGHGAGMGSRADLDRAERWLRSLLETNARRAVYPAEGLRQAAGFVWFRVCLNSAWLGPWAWLRHRRSPLARGHRPLRRERAVFALNAVRSLAGLGPRGPAGRLANWAPPAAGAGRHPPGHSHCGRFPDGRDGVRPPRNPGDGLFS